MRFDRELQSSVVRGDVYRNSRKNNIRTLIVYPNKGHRYLVITIPWWVIESIERYGVPWVGIRWRWITNEIIWRYRMLFYTKRQSCIPLDYLPDAKLGKINTSPIVLGVDRRARKFVTQPWVFSFILFCLRYHKLRLCNNRKL